MTSDMNSKPQTHISHCKVLSISVISPEIAIKGTPCVWWSGGPLLQDSFV